MPLGTAGWMTFPPRFRPICKGGDFFLSNWPAGGSVGYRDDRHVLITAGTRSGKGTSILIPNLQIWPGSTVVIDPKGENAVVMARRRGNGSRWCVGKKQTVRILDPFGEVRREDDTFRDLKARYNPLDLINEKDDEAIEIAGRIADALVVSENSADPFWNESARSLIKAIILHVASWPDIPNDMRNLIMVRNLATAGDQITRAFLERNGAKKLPHGLLLLFRAMSRNRAFDGEVARNGAFFAEMYENAAKQMLGVVGVAFSNLDFLSGKAMKRVVEASNFRLDELKTDPKGSNIFLCLPQRYMNTHHRWLRMMVTLIIGEMERVRVRREHPVMMILDEFPGLGRMKVIETAAAQIAGFGVKLVFVCQTLAQLKETYKENWETLVANAGIKLFFGNDDHFTREYASKLIGEHEVYRTTTSRTETQGQSRSVGVSESTGFTVSSGTSTSSNVSSSPQGGGSSISSNAGTSRTSGFQASLTLGENRSTATGQNETVQKRPLVTPDEIGRLFGDREDPWALALISGYQPLRLKRIAYHSFTESRGNFDPHPDHPYPPTLDRLRKVLKVERAEAQRKRLEAEREYQLALDKENERIRRSIEARRRREVRQLEDARHAERQFRRYDITVSLIALAAFTGMISGVYWLVL
eukprot:Cvel_2800.t1-p1 / transcript=Cvel_2800.t1 / gene=Cvel_2800 / organism=Chromera_velia_CCMP2878 / gene_product=Conjugal transfer protein TraG, putative / transcript_product=Conjugal transfer protein TraG, putative / location=Cvel_scaffold113:18021-19946(-) / protein_length=642 / sequence_SO=supercontig / SO=protein_coding / is_pseudo=false